MNEYERQQQQQMVGMYDDSYGGVDIDVDPNNNNVMTNDPISYQQQQLYGNNNNLSSTMLMDDEQQHLNAIGGDGSGMMMMNATLPDIDFDNPQIAALPRVLVMGPRRGGKSSILRVVFQKMSPHETLFRLEATQHLEKSLVDHTPLCRFTVWDFPGDTYEGIEWGSQQSQQQQQQSTNEEKKNTIGTPPKKVFAGSTSLIFVLDAQDEPYDHVLQSFTYTVTQALILNPHIAVEVFINKVDGELFLSDESKYDCRRDVMSQVTDELTEAGVSLDSIQIRYHLTSIYDHSIYEAFSRVVQRLIPQLPTLENLLNVLVSTCSMEKAYLFDVVSKLYISTDSGPVDMQSVELCSDMIDVVLDVSGIYGLGPSHAAVAAAAAKENHQNRIRNGTNTLSSSSSSTKMITDENDPALDNLATTTELIDPDSAYDGESASVIRLSNGMVLYLKEVDSMLALVCITRSENFRKKTLINYNIGCLKTALQALVKPIDK